VRINKREASALLASLNSYHHKYISPCTDGPRLSLRCSCSAGII